AGGSPKPAKSANLEDVEAMLRSKLGLGLDIDWNEKSGTGKMTIRFATLEQMDEVMAKLMSD
ncbi:MAG: chromosome partitioning protein ParB, partial [Pseudomonadota bacterium]|nr:chromosome partitioning protein ParB [Pseudomonadota bacterium]MEC8216132.1 chromosome partitioning protein ParB [Pseudomonadota bacterium]MEC8270312.1 chromosome partitioning protein ParB [Pseudomonadota bacterium]